MGKIVLWIIGGVVGLIILGSIVGPPGIDPKDPDARSVGRLTAGECMSGDRYNSRVAIVVSNTDWSNVVGAATMSVGTKSLIGGITVFKEMARLGTKACPDLAPLYDQYLAASAPKPGPMVAGTASAVSAMPVQQRATLTTGANIRSGPSTSASIVRVAKRGDSFTVFDTREGWLQIGSDKPEGWVAANLVARTSAPAGH